MFSFAGNKYIWKSPRLLPTPVFIAFGQPTAAAAVNPSWARRELLDLGRLAFEERPVLKRHLGRECVRALTKHPQHLQVIDRTAERRELTNAQIYAADQGLDCRKARGDRFTTRSRSVYRKSRGAGGGQDSREFEFHDVSGRP